MGKNAFEPDGAQQFMAKSVKAHSQLRSTEIKNE